MRTAAQLFRLLIELIFVLLGVLMVLVAILQRFFFDRRSGRWIGLGIILVYLGLRTWWRASRSPTRWEVAVAILRGGSLALVGAMMLGMAWLPFPYIAPLLGGAGGILALRGLVSAVLVARAP